MQEDKGEPRGRLAGPAAVGRSRSAAPDAGPVVPGPVPVDPVPLDDAVDVGLAALLQLRRRRALRARVSRANEAARLTRICRQLVLLFTTFLFFLRVFFRIIFIIRSALWSF